jgi:hypothetical protein
MRQCNCLMNAERDNINRQHIKSLTKNYYLVDRYLINTLVTGVSIIRYYIRVNKWIKLKLNKSVSL